VVLEKIKNNGTNVMTFFDMIASGLQTAHNDLYILKPIKEKKNSIILFSKIKNSTVEIEKDMLKPVLKGEDVKKYDRLDSIPHYVIYPYVIDNKIQKPIEEEILKKEYPLTYNYLFPFKQDLINLRTSFKTNPKYWHGLHRPRKLERFEQEKIITPEISFGGNMTIDTQKFLHTEKVYSFLKNPDTIYDLKYFLAVLNSKVMWFFLKNTGDVLRGGYFTFKTQYLKPFSIPKPSKKIEVEIIHLVDEMIEVANNQSREQQNTQLENIVEIESKINKLVYKLYDFTDEDIMKIES